MLMIQHFFFSLPRVIGNALPSHVVIEPRMSRNFQLLLAVNATAAGRTNATRQHLLSVLEGVRQPLSSHLKAWKNLHGQGVDILSSKAEKGINGDKVGSTK